MAESPTVARARGILDALGDVHDEIPGADPLGDADHVPQRGSPWAWSCFPYSASHSCRRSVMAGIPTAGHSGIRKNNPDVGSIIPMAHWKEVATWT